MKVIPMQNERLVDKTVKAKGKTGSGMKEWLSGTKDCCINRGKLVMNIGFHMQKLLIRDQSVVIQLKKY